MAPGLRSFEVVLNRLHNSFSPGEIVTGKVVVDLGRRKNIRALRVCIKGAARVDWTESSGSGKDCRDDRYTANEEYFRLEYCILGGLGNSENLNIEAGYHEYPFNFCLPQNIPSSFECNHGSVRYTIKAVMDRPWKFDHQTTVSFAVETPYYLTECQSEMDTIEDEEVKSFCCFPCMNMGSMRVQIHMPTAGFAIGEAIEARVSIENNSRTVDVTKVKLQLEQKVKLYSRFPYSKTRRQNHVVQETKNVGPFHKKVQIPMCMQVPAVPQTNLTHCSIIDVHYRLAFKISVSGCHCATWKYYPIVIGTRTTPNLQPTQNTYSMPEFGESSSHFGPMESNVPSAPIDGTPSPSDRISIPLPITNQTFTNPGVTVFPIPTANQSYPPSMPGLFTTSGFQYPRPLNANIGFVDPNSMRTATSTEYPECPPPSYEAVMRAAENK